jgi:ABC-type glycerol-3-phosphate transport system substrate-binding protein
MLGSEETRPYRCREFDLKLEGFADGRLSPGEMAACRAHLDDCVSCRRRLRDETQWLSLLQISPGRERLSPAEAAALRQAVYQRIRRRMIMRQTKWTLQSAAVLVMIVAVGLLVWWQQNGWTVPAEPQPAPTPIPISQVEQVVLTLAVDEVRRGRYEPLIALFEQENPHIRVRLANFSEAADEGDSSIRALASSFDVFPYTPNRQGETHYLLDLRPFLDADPQFDAGDFLPGLLPAVPEPVWAIPTAAAYQVTFFDKGAFNAASLPYPALDWTTEEFLATALALTVRENGQVVRWGYIPGQLRYSPLLATQLTAPLIQPDGLRLSDPDVVTAVQWLSDLFTVHQVSPWLDVYKAPERRPVAGGPTSLSLINSGMAAMWHSTHVLFEEHDERLGVTAVPHGPHGYAADPSLMGYAASRGTRSPDAAWQLLDFLSRQPQSPGLFPVSLVPSRRSVAAATNYWAQAPDALAPVLQFAAENNVAARINFEAAGLLEEAFTAHIDDHTPVAVALASQTAVISATPGSSEVELIVVPEAEPEPGNDTIQITFMSYAVEQHRRLANQFQREHPTIRVRVEIPHDQPGISRLGHVAGSDCFEETAIGDDELRAAVLPLMPLLELDGSLELDDFYPLASDYFMRDGELWALPAWIATALIEYNRGIFQESDVPEPALDWTLDDFLEIARQITSGEGESKRYAYDEPFEYLIRTGPTAFGVQPVDYVSAVPVFDYGAMAEMMIWYADLVRLYEIQPQPTGNSMVDFSRFETLLRGQRLAMWPEWATNIVVVAENYTPLGFDTGIVPLPMGPAGTRGEVTVGGYFIMAGTPHRQACWEWINFLARHPQATGRRTSLPAYIETAQSAAYVDYVGEQAVAASRAYVESLNPLPMSPSISWFRPTFDWLIEAYRQVVHDEMDVTTALASADAKFSEYRQCIIEREAFEDGHEQLECLGLVDPALKRRYMYRP